MFSQPHPLRPVAGPSNGSLEKRPMSISLRGGVRSIKKTRAANEIELEVEQSCLVITVEGASKTFNLSGIRRIRAIGGNGE